MYMLDRSWERRTGEVTLLPKEVEEQKSSGVS